MYQTKATMSTVGGPGLAGFEASGTAFFGDQPAFGGAAPTCVTWPIFLPGLGAPLP
jgi:hypothetical protein